VHIPDGPLDVPTSIATAAVAVVGVAVSAAGASARHGPRTAPLMGVMAAFVFAAQMVNFPVGVGTSGHLIGGVLSAVMLGPAAGVLVIASVLIVQALMFGDGGVTALGANILNMGILGSAVGYAVYAPIRRLVGGLRGVVVGAVAAAWISVILAAVACSIQLAISRDYELATVLKAMLLTHVVIGVGEAAITGLVLSAVVASRPDLIHRPEPVFAPGGKPMPTLDLAGRFSGGLQIVVGGLAIALVVAVFLAPLASDFKDGLEAGMSVLGIEESEPVWKNAPLPDYEPRRADDDETELPWWVTSLVGAGGSIAVGVIAWVLAAGVAGRRSVHGPAPAK